MNPADCPMRCADCKVCVLSLRANQVRFVPDMAAIYDAKAAMLWAKNAAMS